MAHAVVVVINLVIKCDVKITRLASKKQQHHHHHIPKQRQLIAI